MALGRPEGKADKYLAPFPGMSYALLNEVNRHYKGGLFLCLRHSIPIEVPEPPFVVQLF